VGADAWDADLRRKRSPVQVSACIVIPAPRSAAATALAMAGAPGVSL
jgi:hypothetical protein